MSTRNSRRAAARRAGSRPIDLNRPQRAGGPVHLIYVVDLARYQTAAFQEPGLWDEHTQKSYSNVAVGLMFAASVGLSSWFHKCDQRALPKVLGLRSGQQALYGHTVGHPGRVAAGTSRAVR
jgi:hypothetical protein